jgi:quercetin dioxygenase-like cupin family protein
MAPSKPALEAVVHSGQEVRGVKHLLSAPISAPMALALVLGLFVLAPAAGPTGQVEEKKLVENDRVLVMEFVFPAGFRGEEHEAPVDEFAYVLEGEFAVITKGKGKQRVRAGELEWAPKGVVHYSVNETKKPARVLVVLLKGR